MRRVVTLLIAVLLVGLGQAAPGPAGHQPRVLGADTAAESGSWATLGEYRVSPRPTSLADRSREPIVAAHPFDPSRLAVTYPVGGEHSRPVIRISRDGGRTWRTTASRPRGGGSHPMVAWGPGPKRGSARLYYAAMTGKPGNYHFSVSYSNDEGRTWRLGFTAAGTPGWFGGYEDLVVDTNPASPNFGVLYLAYNWPKDRLRGTGMRVVASGDYGRTFSQVEIPRLPSPRGYPDAWRIGYRLTTAPDGSAYVAGYQLDMKVWRFSAPFYKGGYSNIGRIAFGVSRLSYDRTRRSLTHGPNVPATVLPENAWNLGWTPGLRGVNVGLAEPCWATGLVVDDDGRVYFAVGSSGRIRLLTSDDRGRTWRTRHLPQAPDAKGREQRSMRPELVVGEGFLAVLFHTVDASGPARTAGNAVAVSFDRGATWDGPRPVNRSRWRIGPVIATYNGPGLRDRAVLLADGRTLYFAYGDGRDGRSASFGARIRVTVPDPEDPPPSPSPTPTESPSASASPSESAPPTPDPGASESPSQPSIEPPSLPADEPSIEPPPGSEEPPAPG